MYEPPAEGEGGAPEPPAEREEPPPLRGALLARVMEGARSRREGWLWFAAVLGVFAAALLWRWHFASRARVYTYDSYYYLLLARNLRHGLSYSVAGHPHYKYMPFYPVCIAAFDLFLPLEAAGKLSNLVFNAACVFPIYALGALVLGRRAGLAAAALFAFEPISSVWAAVPMSDGLLALLTCLAAYFFLKWFKQEDGRTRHLYLSAAAAGLALLTRWEGALLLLLLGAFLLYAWAKKRLKFANLLIFAAIALAPMALFALRNLITFGTPLKSAYLEELRNHPEWAEYTTPKARFFHYLIFSDVPPLGITVRYYNYGYLLFGYAGLAFTLAVRRYRRYGLFLAGWLLLLGPTHFFWYFSNVRFLIPAVPALCLGAGALVGMPWVSARRARDGIALSAVLLLLVACVVGVLALTGRPVANDRFYSNIALLENGEGGLATLQAVEWLKENAGDAGVASRMAPMVSFYLGREVYFIGEYQGFEPADLRIDHVVEDARALGVRYILLWSYEPDVEGVMAYSGQGPEVAEQLELVGRWEAAPTTQWNRTVYAWIFAVPPE
ncbi:MAG: glycosyltransferase family 39 protein [Actinobacteria bacterium]|nr:glycosyltransferase family 39 protein [Actinomycetota bacterium]